MFRVDGEMPPPPACIVAVTSSGLPLSKEISLEKSSTMNVIKKLLSQLVKLTESVTSSNVTCTDAKLRDTLSFRFYCVYGERPKICCVFKVVKQVQLFNNFLSVFTTTLYLQMEILILAMQTIRPKLFPNRLPANMQIFTLRLKS